MELALFCPVYGYYEKEADKIGVRGDFYTSVSSGSLFGQLLAFCFARLLDGPANRGLPVEILEGGAHDATFARDVLTWLRTHRPGLLARLRYVLVEPSAERKRRQGRILEEFGASVGWVEDFSAIDEQDGSSGETDPGGVL